MKNFALIIIFFVSFSSFCDRKVVETKDLPLTHNEIITEQADSIFLIGDFLFEGQKDMKFEFVRNGEQPKSKIKGDTLYSDNKLVMLGDIMDLTSPGVFKKFMFKSKFQDFKVDKIYNGKLAKPDFSTDSAAKYFITRIKKGCNNLGVNFAGHFTIIEWGCGASCQQMAIVDRINGEIIYSKIPFDTIDGHCGLNYKIDSRMLIINTEALSEYWNYKEGYKREYWRKPAVYEIKERTLNQVE